MSSSHHYTPSSYARSHGAYEAGAGGRPGISGKKIRLSSILGRDNSAIVSSSSRATSIVVDGLVCIVLILLSMVCTNSWSCIVSSHS